MAMMLVGVDGPGVAFPGELADGRIEVVQEGLNKRDRGRTGWHGLRQAEAEGFVQ